MKKTAAVNLLLCILAGMLAAAETPSYRPFELPDNAVMMLALKVGDSPVVPLAENPSTGYGWRLNNDNPAVLALLSEKYCAPENAAGLTGVPGQRNYSFRARQAGSATLVFEYRCPWEKGDMPAKRLTLFVTVQQ